MFLVSKNYFQNKMIYVSTNMLGNFLLAHIKTQNTYSPIFEGNKEVMLSC